MRRAGEASVLEDQVRQADEVARENSELRRINQLHQAQYTQMEKRVNEVDQMKKDHDQHVAQLADTIEMNQEQHEERYQALEARFGETRSERNNLQRKIDSLEKQLQSSAGIAAVPSPDANAVQQHQVEMDELKAQLNCIKSENVELHAAVKRAVAKLDEASSDDPYLI